MFATRLKHAEKTVTDIKEGGVKAVFIKKIERPEQKCI